MVKAKVKDPVKTLREQGNKQFEDKHFEGAIEKYDAAIAILKKRESTSVALSAAEKDDFVKCLTNRAISCFKLDRMTECIDYCTAALEIHPDFLKARYRRGVAYRRLQCYEDAVVDIEQCLKQGADKTTMKLYKDDLKILRPLLQQKRGLRKGGGGGRKAQQGQAHPGGMTNGHHHLSSPPLPPHGPVPIAYPTTIDPKTAPASSSNVVRLKFSPAGATTGHPVLTSSTTPPPPPTGPTNRRSSQEGLCNGANKGGKPMMNGSAPAGEGEKEGEEGEGEGEEDEFPLRPSRRKQARDVHRLLRQARKLGTEPGDIWALLPAAWWTAWQDYVGWESLSENDMEDDEEEQQQHVNEEGMMNGGGARGGHRVKAMDVDEDSLLPSSNVSPPPPINNSVLLARPGKMRVREDLQRGEDWVEVPLEVYKALQSWYGGGPPILRPVAQVGSNGEVVLDLTPQQDFDQALDEEEDEEEKYMDEDDSDRAASPEFEHDKQGDDGSTALKQPCQACEKRTPKRCSRCHKASYCSRGCQASHWKYHRSQCRDDKKPLIDNSRRGKTGLINLGNTCYMNSALQCLSHTYPVTRHFLTNRFKDDLNETSKLGTGGCLPVDYDAMIKDLWFGSNGVVNPLGLKKSIVRFAPMFAGAAQHDSQEVLVFLVDALHEDLNRVKDKPYIETPDDDKRPFSIQAQEAWQRYIAREDSVIVDNLVGQYKSKLVCPDCGHVSVAFDPFNCVTLELPDINLRTMKILVFPKVDVELSGEADEGLEPRVTSQPRIVTIKISRRATIWDVKQELENACGVLRNHLYLALIFDRKVFDFLADQQLLHRIKDEPFNHPFASMEGPDPSFQLTAYEIPEQRRNYVVLQHRQQRRTGSVGPAPGSPRSGEDLEREVIGVPLLLTFEPTWTAREFRAYVWTQIRRLVYVSEEEKGQDGFVESLASSLRIIQTDDSGRTLLRPVEEGDGGQQEEEEHEGQNGDDAMAVGNGEEEGKKEEGGSRGRRRRRGSKEEEEEEGPRPVDYIPDDDQVTIGELLLPYNGAYWMVVDWDGVMRGRFVLGKKKREKKGPGREGSRRDGGEGQGVDDMDVLEQQQEEEPEEEAEEPPSDRLTLDQCFRKFSSPERLDRDNLWYCRRCKKHKQAVKTIQIWRLPKVVIITLKRFDSRDRKLDTPVEFPVEGLDMSPHVYHPSQEEGGGEEEEERPPLLYDLFAVSNHYGSRGWGHYTAYARAWDISGWIDSQWYRYDDSNCEPIHASRVMSRDAYILFYRRREGGGGSARYMQQQEGEKAAAADETGTGSMPQQQQQGGAAATTGNGYRFDSSAIDQIMSQVTSRDMRSYL